MDHDSDAGDRAVARGRLRARHALSAVWTLLVGLLLTLPGSRVPTGRAPDWLDTPAHLLLFAVHAPLLMRSLAPLVGAWRARALALGGSAAYAVALEVAQLWIPGRSWEWLDLFAGLAGVAVAALPAVGRRATLPGPA